MFTLYKDLTDVAVNLVEIMDSVFQLETTMDACVTKATLGDTSVNQVHEHVFLHVHDVTQDTQDSCWLMV